jgi:hypothetical protein
MEGLPLDMKEDDVGSLLPLPYNTQQTQYPVAANGRDTFPQPILEDRMLRCAMSPVMFPVDTF